MRPAGLSFIAAFVIACAPGASPAAASSLHLHSAGGARLYNSVSATKHCLAAHKLFVEPGAPYWPAAHKPAPTAHFIFADHSGDNGYIMFYARAVLATEAANRWVSDQQREVCIPLGHTMSWCNTHLPVPGTRQTEQNVLIDWIAGPKTYAFRQTVTACLR